MVGPLLAFAALLQVWVGWGFAVSRGRAALNSCSSLLVAPSGRAGRAMRFTTSAGFLVLSLGLLSLGKVGARHYQVSGQFGVLYPSSVSVGRFVERPLKCRPSMAVGSLGRVMRHFAALGRWFPQQAQ